VARLCTDRRFINQSMVVVNTHTWKEVCMSFIP